VRATTGDDLVIVPTGTANVASVRAAFRRLGVEPREAVTPEDVEAAARVVLPGVGVFGSAMGAIDAAGMCDVLRDRVDSGRATLAVCVGMQLLGKSSTESPGVAGLGALPAVVSGFPTGVRVPQLGWNQVEPAAGSRYLSPGWAYFANSYRFTTSSSGWLSASAEYAGPFVAALERGSVLAVQFHPELSGPWGAGVLRRWLEAA
jgi:imidazole glycerol-phosphate synthase subunit HisH